MPALMFTQSFHEQSAHVFSAVAHFKDSSEYVNLSGVIYKPEIFPVYLLRRDQLCAT